MNNLPPITKNLLIINTLMVAATIVLYRYGIDLYQYLGLHFVVATDFHPYQFVTYMFMHGGYTSAGGAITGVDVGATLMHLFFNMFALWMFGRVMEQVFGSKRFLVYYMVCGLGAGVLQELAQGIHFYVVTNELIANAAAHGQQVSMSDLLAYDGFRDQFNYWSTVGASGAVYGVLLSFGMTFPNERMFIIPIPFPIKAKYFVMGYVVIELMQALTSSGDGVAHMAHLGGMLFGFLLIRHWRRNGGSGGTYMGGNSWGGYGDSEGGRNGWFRRFKDGLSSLGRKRMNVSRGGKFADEMDYNRRRKQADDEIDKILDKVKKHGYGCLSEDEKRKLFNASGKK